MNVSSVGRPAAQTPAPDAVPAAAKDLMMTMLAARPAVQQAQQSAAAAVVTHQGTFDAFF